MEEPRRPPTYVLNVASSSSCGEGGVVEVGSGTLRSGLGREAGWGVRDVVVEMVVVVYGDVIGARESVVSDEGVLSTNGFVGEWMTFDIGNGKL